MQRIAIDCRFADTQSGLGRYTREIVTHLLRADAQHEYVLLVRDRQRPWLRNVPGHPVFLETPLQHYSLAEHIKMPHIIRQSGAHILFSPHFNVPWFSPVPFVVTIHDLILHRYPNQASLTKRLAYRVLIARAIRNAARIVTVSNFVAEEIASVYGKNRRKKIVTICEGVHAHFQRQPETVQQQLRHTYALPEQFFLYIGNAKEHKNVQMLIDAFASLAPSQTQLVLVTAGKEVQHLRLAHGVRVLENVPEADLPALYSAARAFVTASLYEGFCLPLAEAQACGCPVIAANTSALPEVAGENALLVEPTVHAFAAAFAHPPEHAPPLRLSWDDAAQETALLLHSVL